MEGERESWSSEVCLFLTFFFFVFFPLFKRAKILAFLLVFLLKFSFHLMFLVFKQSLNVGRGGENLDVYQIYQCIVLNRFCHAGSLFQDTKLLIVLVVICESASINMKHIF